MQEIKIEKGVPLPVNKTVNTTRGLTEKLKEMEVGDSLLWPSYSNSGMSSTAAFLGIKIVTRREGDGRRIWRIA